MTASKFAAREIAAKLLGQQPATALDVALEVVRIVSVQQRDHGRRMRLAMEARAVVQDEAACQIVRAVCDHFELCERELRGDLRFRGVSRARFVTWLLLIQRLNWSASQVGLFFGRDHTTVLAGLKKVGAGDDDVVAVSRLLDASEAAE